MKFCWRNVCGCVIYIGNLYHMELRSFYRKFSSHTNTLYIYYGVPILAIDWDFRTSCVVHRCIQVSCGLLKICVSFAVKGDYIVMKCIEMQKCLPSLHKISKLCCSVPLQLCSSAATSNYAAEGLPKWSIMLFLKATHCIGMGSYQVMVVQRI